MKRKTRNIADGVAAGATIGGSATALFGSTAAMSIATTFGTASTGTAISTLSGAAVNRNDECTENGKLSAQKTVTTVHKNQ